MREILLVCAVVVVAAVAGTAATHAVRGFWCGANGASLDVSVGEIDPAPMAFDDEWRNNPSLKR